MTLPGFCADASLYKKPTRYHSIPKDYCRGQGQVQPEWWGGDLVDWVGEKLGEGIDWVGGTICDNCNAIGVAAGAGCAAGTDGIGLIGGACGVVGGTMAVACHKACGR